LFALFFVVPRSSAQSPPSGTLWDYTISGTVLNSVTREPIGRALVYPAMSAGAFKTITTDGIYRTIVIPTGRRLWGLPCRRGSGFLEEPHRR
jgi:hypothetical protein